MTSRDHMPGYAPALDNESMRDADRLPFPLGVPNRVKAEHLKRRQDFVGEILRDVLAPFDPFTVTHMTQSDVPGVLIAAGAEHVVKALQRVADKGVNPEGMAAALRGRAVQEDERYIVDAVDVFLRQRTKKVTATERDRMERQAKADMLIAQQSAATGGLGQYRGLRDEDVRTMLHPQAGQVMQGFVTAEQVRNQMMAGAPYERFRGYDVLHLTAREALADFAKR